MEGRSLNDFYEYAYHHFFLLFINLNRLERSVRVMWFTGLKGELTLGSE